MEIQPSTPSVSSVDPSIAQEDQVLHEAVAHKPIAQSHTPENADGVVVISLDGRAKSESDRADDDSDEDRSSDEESDAGVEGDEDTPKSKTEDGMKCKLKQLYKEDINRHDWWSDTKPYGHESDKTRYALIVRNVFNDDADASRRTRIHSVVIQSPLLKAILRKILDGYPGLALTTDRLTFSSPFQPLVHHWDTIKDAAEKEENEQARRHLKLLITSLETELSEDLEAVRHFNEHKVIRFKHLWAIFHPEELVYSKQGKAECLFKLKRTEYIKSNGVTYLLLHSHFVEWDGDRFGKANKVLAIPEFRESAPFSDLSSYPFRCHPHQDELMKKLEARGRRFHELSGFSYKAYTGVGIDETDPRDIKAFHVDGRIVVDTSSYLQFNANEKVNLTSLVDTTATVELNAQEQYDPYGGTYFRSGDIYGQPMLNWQEVQEAIKTNDKSGAKPKQELSVDELLLCSHMLRGFSLKMKNWREY